MSEDVTLTDFSEDTTIQSDEIRSSLDVTSLGDIPSDWQKVRLEDVVHESNYGASESAEEYDSEKPRYVRITDINERGRLKSDTKVSLSKERANGHLLKEGNLLFARSGASVGKTYLYRSQDGECAYAGYLIQQKIDKEVLNPEFLYQYTDSPRYNNWVDRIQRTGAQPNINAQEYGGLLIPYPPLPEQRKIATVLYTVDQAIEKTEELIKQKKRLRDAVAQESLVLETNSYIRPTEWGRIPESWEEKTLEEVCQLITDGTHMPPEHTKTGIPLIGVDEIDGIQLDFSGDLSYISEEDYQEMSDSNKPHKEDVLVAVVGATIGKSAIVTQEEPFAIQRSLGLLRTNESVLPRFLHTVVQSPNFKRQLDTRSRATAQAGVYLEELKHVRIPVPPIEEQEEIADRIDEITHSIRNENEYLNSLKRLKRGLMQDLLSGTVRTTDTNIEVPEEIAQYG